ncbi:sensor histidine kinase [Algihabitans sp.]|uniref:sensor histidine kinase n=1 Tax=Algihabitans sp. TaxID=2821514 RepID=UPI003BA9C4AA
MVSPNGPAATRRAARQGRIASKLRNAFVGVSLFSLLAALVAVASYQVVERAQDEVLDRSLPAALGTERLVSQVLLVLAATPSLIATEEKGHLQREMARLQSVNREFQTTAEQIRDSHVADELLGRIEEEFNEFTANLKRQVDLIATRNRLSARLTMSSEESKQEVVRLIDLLKPEILEASATLLTKTDGLRDVLSPPGTVTAETSEVFAELVDSDYYLVERLTEMRFLSDNLIRYINELVLTGNAREIPALQNRLAIDLRRLTRSAVALEDTALREEVAQSLQRLLTKMQGPDSVFAQQSDLIDIRGQLSQLGADNFDRATRLRENAELLSSRVSALIAASSKEARDAVALGRIVLAIIAATALVAAVYVSWRFVLKDVTQRMAQLVRTTRDIAQGNLDVEIAVAGDDELGDMAQALEVFKANAADLRRSNAELEQFAYVASHDLKAPLRGIANLAAWIEKDAAETMSEDAKQYLTLLQGRTERMGRLLDDLLQYSRAGREKAEVRLLDLNSTLPDLFRMTAAPDGFRLEIPEPLPSLTTAYLPLEQVFLNLIGNAVKHHDQDSGCIRITAVSRGSFYEFLVRDDGPGIAAQFHEKVFAMFQALKSRDDVEGSGMGLAIVRKLIESAGGKIAIESNPETARGTAFRFTWPKHWTAFETALEAA